MSEYVAFDIKYLLDFYNMIRSSVGTIATIAFFTFTVILGVFAVVDIIRRFT